MHSINQSIYILEIQIGKLQPKPVESSTSVTWITNLTLRMAVSGLFPEF
jgi:hypothetical protein